MPAASCGLPRQMLPPPTTTATLTPSECTAAISFAIAVVVSTSTLPSAPANASPESFSRTRLKAGVATGELLAECELGEAADRHLLAENAGDAVYQLTDRNRIVLHERLLEHDVILKPLVELAFDDLLSDRRRLALGNLLRELFTQLGDLLDRHRIAVEELGRHRRDVHRDVPNEILELVVARDEV